ncbi:uncharacterized protein LOC130991623 [Salvia miltiorrhiza]|uniref:uncharacterized protein LOC130991623 n=1 Tax=Salvia miltiorrhiza TaxID=226208 RepID=UPI0025AC85ED|nr:uncharacterized protein LOC130991623 [Salvia miltiorrhiza]
MKIQIILRVLKKWMCLGMEKGERIEIRLPEAMIQGERIETGLPEAMIQGERMETGLPEAMIQLIQSFLSEEDAARTTLISKSWYNAWQTRPVLVLRNVDWRTSDTEFSKFALKAMRRYQDSNLRIESLRLKFPGYRMSFEPLAHRLIVDAMKMGATDLKIEFFSFVLPPEVLLSETLLRLSVFGCEIDGSVKCSMLKSLSLDRVVLKSDDMLRIITSCCNSIEELSLSNFYFSKPRIILSGKNMHELHKLKRLYLKMLDFDSSLFFDLESRFPCLEDMSLVRCHYYRSQEIRIISSSLQHISIVQTLFVFKVEFEVPNLAVFSYSGSSYIPSFSIKARDEFECLILLPVEWCIFATSSWYRYLPRLLIQLSPSRINLTINMVESRYHTERIAGVYKVHVRREPVAVENTRLEASCLCCICCPQLVSHCWLDREWWMSDDHSLKSLCEKLTDPKRDRNMFGQFDLKEGKMEVYKEDAAEWQPLLLQDALTTPPTGRKVRFHLKWC